MYDRPHLIWVEAFVFQSDPAEPILLAGSDCGMPYAPDDLLRARSFQPLSPFHKFFRAAHCGPDQPWAAAKTWPICWFADDPLPPPPRPSRPMMSPPRPPRALRALPGSLVMLTKPFLTIDPRALGRLPNTFFAMAVPDVLAMPFMRPETR